MEPLEPPDTHYITGAIGWLELGNAAEGLQELGKVRPELAAHPDVLDVRWTLLARLEDWPEALDVAKHLLRTAPARVSGWLHHSYSLRRVRGGSLEAAWDALLPAFDRFPAEPTIAYNLSCYACQLGNLDLAREWFRKALQIGEKNALRAMALRDPDLMPLWDEIRARNPPSSR